MHLRSLQALDAALRTGSLKAAAEGLGITPAAVGQRIRALEAFLGHDLLLRGRSGLTPTPELRRALADLHAGFAALERVTDALEFQRVAEIHVVADPDWAELWLAPRLPAFREANPNIRFCINGEGDVPMRLGAPDCRIAFGGPDAGEPLYSDVLLPLASQDNVRRLGDWDSDDEMEGLSLLHVREQLEDADRLGWPDWFARYGGRRSGRERGVLYRHMRVALEAMRDDVGFLFCGLSLVEEGIAGGTDLLPYPAEQHLVARHPYRLWVRAHGETRPQLARFLDWLRAEAEATAERLANPEAAIAALQAGNRSAAAQD